MPAAKAVASAPTSVAGPAVNISGLGLCGADGWGTLDTVMSVCILVIFVVAWVLILAVALPASYGSMLKSANKLATAIGNEDGCCTFRCCIRCDGPEADSPSLNGLFWVGLLNFTRATLGIWDRSTEAVYAIRLRAKKYALDDHDLTIKCTIRQNMQIFNILGSGAIIAQVGNKLNDPPLYVHSDIDAPVPGKYCPSKVMRIVKWLTSAGDLFGLTYLVFVPGQLQATLAILLVLPKWLSSAYEEHMAVFAGYASMRQFKAFAALGIDPRSEGVAMLAQVLDRAATIVRTKIEEKARSLHETYEGAWQESLGKIREVRGTEALPTATEAMTFHNAAVDEAIKVLSPKMISQEISSQIKDESSGALAQAAGQRLNELKEVLSTSFVDEIIKEPEIKPFSELPTFKTQLKKLVALPVSGVVNTLAAMVAEKLGVPVEDMGLTIDPDVAEGLAAAQEAKDIAKELAPGPKSAKVAPA